MMTSKVKKTGRDRQNITRMACEPCRAKRAKCDGQNPCGRCQAREIKCDIVQRAWASKRTLRDEAAILREKLCRRDCVLGALSVPGSGDDVIRMLRQRDATVDQVFENLTVGPAVSLNSDVGVTPELEGHGRGRPYDWEGSWSPSIASSNVPDPSQGRRPISCTEMENEMENENKNFAQDDISDSSRNSLFLTISDQQQQSEGVQAVPWGTSDTTSFGTMLDSTMAINLNSYSCPHIFDPLLSPIFAGSYPLRQPMLNSWTGLVGDVNNDINNSGPFPCNV